VKASDLPLLNSVSAPTVRPDGARAVVAVTHPDFDADAAVGQLWTIPLTGHAAPRRMTRGFRDTAPQYSPDGRLIAFLRAEPGKPAQLHVVDAGGGEPVSVTDRALGVSEFRWSPDGSAIAFVSRDPEQGRYGTVDGLGSGAEPARHITVQNYRANGLGYTIDRRAHIYLVTVPDVTAEPAVQPAPSAQGPAETRPVVPEPQRLTDGDFDHGALAFSPDGGTLAFVSARHEERDADLRSNVFLMRLSAEGEPLEVTDVTGSHGDFSVPDGHGCVEFGLTGAVYFLAQDVGESGRDFVAKNTSLFVIERAGEAPKRLTDPEVVDLGEIGSGITPLDDRTVLVPNRTRGTVQLVSVASDGTVQNLTRDAPIEITGAATAGRTVVVSFTDERTAGDVAMLENGGLRTVTNFSAALRASGLAAVREFTAAARDGYPVHGWVVVPDGDGPHPVLLDIHGGPFAQYGVHVFDEAQVYADAGYAVLLCNPRGSAGYGQAHGRTIRQAMGTVDLADVLDYLDGATAAFSELDAGRVGIMGGSYGGYLTAWTIAHDHRFAAAIVERGYLDPEAFVGTSDIGSFFSDEYTGTDADGVRAQSPQAHVGAVTTPTLVLHSEDDLRCPLPQAERYYAALKRGGVDAELVIFPGENHELSRSGRPRHRLQRFGIILDWWARHLPSAANQASRGT
jgi:Dipeptidyl aminopeptidases/acylaminoacyl-peptidases